MMAVLIVIAWIGGGSSGPLVTMHDFSTVAKCEAARSELMNQYQGWASRYGYDKIMALCVQK